jgi:hypothetical protein
VPGFGDEHDLGFVRSDGRLTRAFASPGGPIQIGGWLSPSLAIGNAYVIPPGAAFSPSYWRPVVIDFDSRTLQPILMQNRAEGAAQPTLFRRILAVETGD